MTQEMARELIDGIDFYDKHQMWGAFPDRYDPYTVYELAELVAGLKYQYAAQVRRGTASPWLYVLQNGHFSKRGSTSVWCKKQHGCENAIRSALKRKDVGADTVEFRIVRRLVSEPEVAE